MDTKQACLGIPVWVLSSKRDDLNSSIIIKTQIIISGNIVSVYEYNAEGIIASELALTYCTK